MIVTLFGIIDILMGIALILLRWDVKFLSVIAILFMIKTLVYIKSLASVIDLIAGIIFLLAFYGVMYNFITWIAAIWLLQKGIVSLFST